ncbi:MULTISPECIES: hypothetical protein [Burkholderia]|uniref:Fis family transcriptional regulator n=2 Tax=Burkholderia cepacia complex TaxID=87882 RepID=A0ABD4UDU4_9BURK|nr:MULTISPECIES: hypothetical protein [Burkholderia]MBM6430612.1 hypothetical protein [Burkholderia contaminans]MBR8016584.1 hypothetical protein [Burkholderia vietnamiensis]MBR8164808.1 hypothetical protein [Burkholderia vietnamiensis]MBR8231812.1 hypothetical protein [Burkholderia vietnamiensis]MCA7881097.1 hypothetical protein [Burkholderia contaminans]
MLLPLSARAARDLSLANHLTFVACKQGAGNPYLLNELIRFVYLTFYVQEAGYGDTALIVYSRAEAALERCMTRAERDGVCQLDADDSPHFEAVLCQADRQIECAPLHYLIEARERLERFARSSRQSPLPSASTVL